MDRSARARPFGIRVRRGLRKLRPRRTCAECGFLAYGEEEARQTDRVLLGCGSGSGTSPSGPAERWNCAKRFWLWELSYIQPDWGVVFDEVAKDRRGCRGFRRWKPGWSPAQHAESEERLAGFWRQLILKVTPKAMVLLSGLIGVSIVSIIACCRGD